MASVTARRPTLLTAPAVLDFAASTQVFSPLDQVGLSVHSPDAVTTTTTAQKPADTVEHDATPPIPTLDFNLFRSPSIYSVDSSFDSASDLENEAYGFGFVSEPEEGLDSDSTEDGGEQLVSGSSLLLSNIVQLQRVSESDEDDALSPPAARTPRPRRTISGDTVGATTPSASRTATPTPAAAAELSRDGSARGARGPINYPSLPNLPYSPKSIRSAVSNAPFSLQPVPLRTVRSLSGPLEPDVVSISNLTIQTQSQQRSCSEPVPQPQPAPVAARPEHTTVPDTASVHGEQGSDWGEDENGFEWLDKAGASEAANNGPQRKPSLLRLSPRRLTRLRSVVGISDDKLPTSPSAEPPAVLARAPTTGGSAPRPKKKRPIVIPRRAAPPPPPNAPPIPPGIVIPSRSHSVSSPTKHIRTPSPDEAEILTPESIEPRNLPPVVVIAATPPRAKLDSSRTAAPSPLRASSQMSSYPVSKDATAGSSLGHIHSRSHSNLHSSHADTSLTSPDYPRRGSGGSASEQWEAEEQRRRLYSTRRGSGGHSNVTHAMSPTSSNSSLNVNGRTPEEIVAAGIGRRKANDLAKSTWLFMKAAEAGSVTGQIHWGYALRYGIGIGRDERRGFSALLKACDRSLAEGGVDLRANAGTLNLTTEQKRSMAPDTALGLVEVANCFLDGIGIKRNPDMALEYFRMAGSLGDISAQEQLGYVLSKGTSGIKKDMREAAKWYRAAIKGGSTVPGVAWVWKDKYNEP